MRDVEVEISSLVEDWKKIREMWIYTKKSIE
jgi:hypothetical protein